MSQWTHISASIVVETGVEDTEIKKIVENALEIAPKITGSEGCADVFVNIPSGYNTSCYPGCNSCKYGNIDDDESCDAPEDYKCPFDEYQTCAVITVAGDLRDRKSTQTQNEFNSFVKYIEKSCDYYIDNMSVSIKEG